MKKLLASPWKSLQISSPTELRAEITLLCGQVFTWRKVPNFNDRFLGVIGQNVVELKETKDQIYYRTHSDASVQSSAQESTALLPLLQDYFQLHKGYTLASLHDHFEKQDELFYKQVFKFFPGLRVVRQDPFECLISFICSSNNNVSRIMGMIQRLMEKYGTYIGEVDTAAFASEAEEEDEVASEVKQEVKEEDSQATTQTSTVMVSPASGRIRKKSKKPEKSSSTDTPTVTSFYTFPTLKQMQSATEKELKELGFGYRAVYIVQTVKKLASLETDFLDKLRDEPSSDKVIEELTKFKGVGTKVAACVALYSLDKLDCVPIDVHILRITKRHYLSQMKAAGIPTTTKSISPKMMKDLMQLYRTMFGQYAGVAQMILYSSQISAFKSRLPTTVAQALQASIEKEEENADEEDEEQTVEQKEPKSTPKKHSSPKKSPPKKKRRVKNESEDDTEGEEVITVRRTTLRTMTKKE